MAGYYTAYYINGGKKTKSPNDLIKEIHEPKKQKHSFEDGLKAIERIRALERLSKSKIYKPLANDLN